ncbi:MAG TPA: preprotein translocase subunit YajC [Dehalococcoidia bacterium]|jgi:preprotein translocase YajC subunit|nr:preprotein translocase subunit YajC [Dehalococcoidia bacterium]
MNDAELLAAVIFGVVVAFYFMFMRPVQKEQEQHKKQMRDLRPGDEVLTTSNFVATVREIQIGEDGQTRISLEIADGVIVTAFPNAIMRPLRSAARPAVNDPSERKGAST